MNHYSNVRRVLFIIGGLVGGVYCLGGLALTLLNKEIHHDLISNIVTERWQGLLLRFILGVWGVGIGTFGLREIIQERNKTG